MRAKEFTETFSDSRLRNLPGGRRSSAGAGSNKGDLIKITPKGIKVFGSMQFLGAGDWVEIRDTGYQKKIKQVTPHMIRLDDGKFYKLHNLRYPIDESINEGGWEDTITQQTKLNPAVVKEALNSVKLFVSDLNGYLEQQGFEPVQMGHPLGSTAYVDVDTEETEYGDIDMQMIAPEIPGKSSFQISKHYNDLIDQFINDRKPGYIHRTGKPSNGHPIFKLHIDMYIQVDMLWTVKRLAKWDRWRKTPMQGIKGLIMGNLYSTLGEVINMSLQSAVLMKLKGGEPINYQRGRGQDEIVEVTIDIENFGTDILNYVYQAVKGGPGKQNKPHIDPELKQYPGLNTDNVQISDVVHTIKGLAKSFQLNNLYGKHVLKDLKDADDLINTYLTHYLDKADKAGRGAKLDKAETPEELAQVQLLRDKIAKGVKLVKQAFASGY